MATGNRVELTFAGDDRQLQKTFENVGQGAKEMATDVGQASKRMSTDTDLASTEIAGRIDSSEKRFRGMGDTINGTGDIMEGFRTGNVALLAMGMADMAGAMTDFIVPALNTVKNAIVTGLAPAFTLISAHPLIAGLIAGGAIIAGLIILEKKFGLVSSAVEALGDVFKNIWPGIKAVINGIIGGLEFIGNAALMAVTAPIQILNRIPGVKSIVPDIPKVKLPRLHTGGIAGRDTLAILQQGEQVIPRGQGGSGGLTVNVSGVGMGRDFGEAVARALRDNRLIGVTV